MSIKFTSILILFFIACCVPGSAQTCEDFDISLFAFFPDPRPDIINCSDDQGKKQGWWFHYNKQWESLANGGTDSIAYVSGYKYGQYKNDQKIGEWLTVVNGHLAHVTRTDSYLYAKDTILVSSSLYPFDWCSTITYYNSDSTQIKFKATYSNESKNIEIDCDRRRNKAGSSCRMTYQNKLIKIFPHKDFEIEAEKSLFMYEVEKSQIDRGVR